MIICRTQTPIDELTQKNLMEYSNNYLLVSNKLFVKFLGLNIFNFFVFKDIVCEDLDFLQGHVVTGF